MAQIGRQRDTGTPFIRNLIKHAFPANKNVCYIETLLGSQ